MRRRLGGRMKIALGGGFLLPQAAAGTERAAPLSISFPSPRRQLLLLDHGHLALRHGQSLALPLSASLFILFLPLNDLFILFSLPHFILLFLPLFVLILILSPAFDIYQGQVAGVAYPSNITTSQFGLAGNTQILQGANVNSTSARPLLSPPHPLFLFPPSPFVSFSSTSR